MTFDDEANPLEADSLESDALHDFVRALMDGELLGAGKCLLALQGFELEAIECLADVLDGTATPDLFPWRLKIRMRQLGRPVGNIIPKTTMAPLHAFYAILSTKDVNEVAKFLRLLNELNEADLEAIKLTLAALFRTPGANELPWYFTQSAKSVGAPGDHPIEKFAWYFRARNLRNLVDAALAGARGQMDLAVEDVSNDLKKRGIRLGKATIYKILRRLRDFNSRDKDGIS
jgi:hypothetical protein